MFFDIHWFWWRQTVKFVYKLVVLAMYPDMGLKILNYKHEKGMSSGPFCLLASNVGITCF